MKTLYVRIVLTFLAIIVFSLLSSVLIGFALFQSKLNHLGQAEMTAAGEQVTHLYERTRPQDVDGFLTDVSRLISYPLVLFGESDPPKTFGPVKAERIGAIAPEAVRQVLRGQPYRSAIQGIDELAVGLPLEVQGRTYALFLLTSSKNESTILQFISTLLVLVLAAGSLCILVAARYLVKPLRTLTTATRALAKGRFDVELKLKRKDELGELARSFNEMARDLKQLEGMRQDFVSNVSHEIQSPLTSISGFAEALKSPELVTEENRTRYLDIIVAESERLSRLSDNLLRLASLESEHHPFEARTFHLDESIRQVAVATEPLWAAKRLTLDLKLPPALKITADPDQLNQLWTNLLGNSIKFTPPGGRITMELVVQGDTYMITVADTGVGISPEDLGRVFDRFYKADRSRRGGSGSGLGLSIVRQIVHLHQGRIEAASLVGQGTTVTVTLPRNAAPLRPPNEEI
ncbi:cell wall metabolism sensor histidine kinase WalK [Cohnella sp. REN36]|uniref:sensor histidine kinase n=1 Tax=Cohnella sp. REN36 TaxID=2887347 RepID=UPI001D1352EF|nr:HAMP domain-containing sensor histidine kinase [Cohnella sp. REN36]MCC3373815.1 HAMP domain-containing histidine kinase [Cohnella sp. REN36]